jgi:shikimate dehydrogenase
MMGSGKTSAGRVLASRLGFGFVDTDEMIGRAAGMSVAEIFRAKGENFFRDLEAQAVKMACSMERVVVSCGGGAVTRQENAKELRAGCIVFYLQVSPQVAAGRITDASTRPLLAGRNPAEALHGLLEKRRALYESAAHFSVNANGAIGEVAGSIASILGTGITGELCAVISATSETDAIGQVKAAKAGKASAVELREDIINAGGPGVSKLVAECKSHGLKTIVTLRDAAEGGKFGGNDEEKISVLKSALAAGTDFIDVEAAKIGIIESISSEAKKRKCKIISSFHDTGGSKSAAELESIMLTQSKVADVVKIAVKARPDFFSPFPKLQKTAKEKGIPLIATPFGEGTFPERIACALRGSAVIYAAVGEKVAPGQPALYELRMALDGFTAGKTRISGMTGVLAVIGDPIGHSLSPAIYNSAFAALGIDAVYVALRVAKEDLAAAVAGMKAIGISGFNVTIPHKAAVMPLLDDVDPLAQEVGAVNTVVNESGRLRGFNTDVAGFREGLKTLLPEPKNLRVVLLGAGGASKAVLLGLDQSCEVTIINRTAKHARELAKVSPLRRTEVRGWNEGNIKDALSDADLLVNATSLGLGGELPIPVEWISKKVAVFDLVYRKEKSAFVQKCLQSGLRAADGLEMLLHQAFGAFRIFTGKDAPEEAIRASLGGK